MAGAGERRGGEAETEAEAERVVVGGMDFLVSVISTAALEAKVCRPRGGFDVPFRTRNGVNGNYSAQLARSKNRIVFSHWASETKLTAAMKNRTSSLQSKNLADGAKVSQLSFLFLLGATVIAHSQAATSAPPTSAASDDPFDSSVLDPRMVCNETSRYDDAMRALIVYALLASLSERTNSVAGFGVNNANLLLLLLHKACQVYLLALLSF